jgi:hypothetical protein
MTEPEAMAELETGGATGIRNGLPDSMVTARFPVLTYQVTCSMNMYQPATLRVS